MRIILTEKEKKDLSHLKHIGDGRGYKVYDIKNKILLQANITLLCDCGRKHCEHKRMLLLKLLKEYKVI